MHNSTNSTYFSHFWSNIQTIKLQNKQTPTLFSRKSSVHTDSTAVHPQWWHDAQEMLTQHAQIEYYTAAQAAINIIRNQRHVYDDNRSQQTTRVTTV